MATIFGRFPVERLIVERVRVVPGLKKGTHEVFHPGSLHDRTQVVREVVASHRLQLAGRLRDGFARQRNGPIQTRSIHCAATNGRLPNLLNERRLLRFEHPHDSDCGVVVQVSCQSLEKSYNKIFDGWGISSEMQNWGMGRLVGTPRHFYRPVAPCWCALTSGELIAHHQRPQRSQKRERV